VDPYVDGVFILALESEVPGTYEPGVEEFYGTVKSLPVPGWEDPPLGTKLTFGRIRTEFGRNNRLHLHDLPQSNRPLAVESFLGDEGHVANGGSAQLFLPSPGDTALELTLQALQGGGIEVAQSPNHPAYLANLRLYVPLGPDHSVDAALIGFYGTNDREGRRQSRVVSLDVLYRWKPAREGEWKSIVVGGQVFAAARHEFHEDIDVDGDGTLETVSDETSPVGGYAWAQVQLSRVAYVGVRADRSDFLNDDDALGIRSRRKGQVYASCYFSEFFRLRASLERTWSDDAEEDGLLTFMLELTVVFGAHPPEPFWVNR
jgi:hypothetical protein